MSEKIKKDKGEIKQEANQDGVLSGFNLPAYQLSFLRRVLGTERLGAEDAKVRNHFVFEFLVPLLEKIDVSVAEIRDKYAQRNPATGQIKVTEKGQIDYGENDAVSFKEFNDLMGKNVFVPIENRDVFLHIFDLFLNTKYLMNEEETVIFQQIVETFKAVQFEPKK